MELLKLSRFKLQLQTLISEIRELREKERFSSDHLKILVQKNKQTEDGFDRKLAALEVDLASSNEIREQLERKVDSLEEENSLLQIKQKELKGTISSLLRSKEGFIKAYENSTYEMKRSIESRDRKIAMLSEKINAHLASFNSIQKEASSVKQIVDDAQQALSEKEEVEKINELEDKLRGKDEELQKKNRTIAELEIQLEIAKISDRRQSKIEELQESLVVKEGIIQNLISENKTLHFKLGRLEVTIKKIQDTVTRMNEENRVAFSSVLANQENPPVTGSDDDRINDDIQSSTTNSNHESPGNRAESTASPVRDYNAIINPSRGNNNNFDSCVLQPACSPPNLACFGSQTAANTLTEEKVWKPKSPPEEEVAINTTLSVP